MDRIKLLASFLGAVGGILSNLLGGWDYALQALVLLMAADYLTGIIVAGVFKKSDKTENGALSSKVGWQGLTKKAVVLLVILIAVRLDLVMGSNFLRYAVIFGYMANELVSIVENLGLMGVPVPGVINRAIEALKNKGNGEDS